MVSSVKQSKTNVTPCLHRTRAARQNTIEVVIISDAVYTGCCAARIISTENCCRILFMTCWHKTQMIFNGRFIASSVVLADFSCCACRVWCRHGVTNLSRRNKATSASDRRPSAPWVLSSAGKLIRYLHGSYFLPYRSADVFLFCFFIHHLYLLSASIGSATVRPVHWTLSPPHHE